MPPPLPRITRDRYDAVLFDLDGVLTATAKMHARCWKEMFDEFLLRRSKELHEPFRPFDIEADYKPYVDGKPRFDGVRSFLESRGIHLPEGQMNDTPGLETIRGLGNRKNELVQSAIAAGQVEVYPGAIRWVRWLRDQGFKLAVVSSSRNCKAILRAVDMDDPFDDVVDGLTAEERNLQGKPMPDTFLYAAQRLGATPDRTIVVEDALAGVQAGRAGGFALVIGVNQPDALEALLHQGADVVVSDLDELIP